MKSYCVKQKKVTECVPGSEKYVTAKDGRTMMKCKCAECWITKTKFVKSKNWLNPHKRGAIYFNLWIWVTNLQNWRRELKKRTRGNGILSSIADTGAELFINKGIPYLAKKGTEAGRYYASEFMRDPKIAKESDWLCNKESDSCYSKSRIWNNQPIID